MSKSVFDIVLRRLVQQHPQELLSLLFGEDAPTFVRAADTSLPQTDRRADAVLIVEKKRERFVTEVEFQASPDAGFVPRLLDYAVRAHRREGLPVLPVAIYVRREAEATPSPYEVSCLGQPVLSFHFQVVRLWEVDYSRPELQQPALLPLAVLEEKAGPERIETLEGRLRAAPALEDEERLDLLVALATLADSRFGTARLTQSLRRVMLESPFVQEQVRNARSQTLLETLQGIAQDQGVSLSPQHRDALGLLEAGDLQKLVRQVAAAADAAAVSELLAAATRRTH